MEKLIVGVDLSPAEAYLVREAMQRHMKNVMRRKSGRPSVNVMEAVSTQQVLDKLNDAISVHESLDEDLGDDGDFLDEELEDDTLEDTADIGTVEATDGDDD